MTEGTTNLCDPAYMYTNTWTTIGYDWRRTIINCTAGDIISISADIKELSQGGNRRWGQVAFHDSGGIELEFYNAMGSGMSEQRLSFTTPAAPMGTVEARVYWVSSGDGVTYQGKNFQIEKKPYDTPFVDGTRPDGSLSYDLPISINGDWTIAKWLELEPYFMDKTLSGDNPIGKYRLPLLELGEKYYTEGHGTLGIYGAWADSAPGKTIRIMANKDQVVTYSSSPETISLTEAEYNNKILAVLTKSGSMLTAYIYTVENKYVLTCNIASLGDISQITPRLNYHTVTASSRMYCKRHLNTLVCPYAVSPETIATWYSSDTSFYDFSENPLVSNSIIVEQGSNENGEYIRWENGLQVCWGSVDIGPINAAFGNAYISAPARWDYPSLFSAHPSVSGVVMLKEGSALAAHISGDGVMYTNRFHFYGTRSSSSSNDYIAYLLAIGRWK